MKIESIISDLALKPKEKIEMISQLLTDKKLSISELLKLAEKTKDPDKANCIEAIEFATKLEPGLAKLDCLDYVTICLTSKAPRIKWESAKVIGNIAAVFPNNLELSIKNLLINTNHEGTVVRWSAAFALGEILKLKNSKYKSLLATLESVCDKEEKNSIKKIYLSAFKNIS